MLRSSLFLVHLEGAEAGAEAAVLLALVTLAVAILALVLASREREGPGAAYALPSGGGRQVQHYARPSYANPCHHEEIHGLEAGKHGGPLGESAPNDESGAVAGGVMLAASPYEKVACDD